MDEKSIYADLSNATASTIGQLRNAMAIQKQRRYKLALSHRLDNIEMALDEILSLLLSKKGGKR